MNLTNVFLTTTAASATTSGVSIAKTGLPSIGKVALIIQPNRSGDIRLQNASGILANGKYITIPQSSGGDDAIIINFDNIATMPGYLAGVSGTVSVTYTVVMVK